MSRFAAQATAVDHKRIGGPLATNLHNLNPLPRFQIINCTPHRGHAKSRKFSQAWHNLATTAAD